MNLCWSQSSLWARHHRSPHLDLKKHTKTLQPLIHGFSQHKPGILTEKPEHKERKELKEQRTQGPASSK